MTCFNFLAKKDSESNVQDPLEWYGVLSGTKGLSLLLVDFSSPSKRTFRTLVLSRENFFNMFTYPYVHIKAMSVSKVSPVQPRKSPMGSEFITFNTGN